MSGIYVGLSSGNVGIGTGGINNVGTTLNVNGDVSAGFLIGQVSFFTMSTAPTGWLKCNGAAISRTTYAKLFAVTGTTYGVGDGSTTFNLPDLRGEFIRGFDDGRTIDSGRTFGSSQTDTLQNITGSMGQIVHYSITTTGSLGYTNQASSIINPGTGGYYGWGTLNIDTSRNCRTSTETRSRNLALLACIKF